ncbi:hypothetical protein CERSUDRAFT_72861 [Gelatoporia subvermispora B]|uniref:PhoD-like phosphatase metallophosphatase domain-containing protein n=1 Tax=Ceriporiopsis subvermispora (strain B) TaxID=914234 RepID=M2RIM0_CERS8|nr:hypothetical protein CERSUDRAFT_72861 [Gelatoporia subvermispora B]
MMVSASFLCLMLCVTASATRLLDHNLVYTSPFRGYPQFSHDTRAIEARHVHNVKRQVVSAGGFEDEHYPGFLGSDFSNSPFLWGGGINFTHSVASCVRQGDPLDTSVLLWTRAAPVSEDAQPDQDIPICATFKIFDNPSLSGRPIDSSEAFTTYDVDFTLKLEATGLRPDTTYWYQFSDCTNSSSVSPVGKTRTISSPDRWFNAYGVAAQNTSADLFIHLGDYVLGRELATIADYRQRLNQYRTDPGLLLAHANAPWITDDHEVADQSWKAGTANSNDTASGCSFSPSGACFTDRKWAGVRAYHEWMPIRQLDPNDKLRIWRNFQIGKLLDLTMLDTRQYDRDITDLYYNTAADKIEDVNSIADVNNRSLMGADQENSIFAGFYNTLSQSKARGAVWRIVGSGTLFKDAWDGYRANRNRILGHLYNNDIDNTIILSGDSHANWNSHVPPDPNDTVTYDPTTGEGAIGVEFAGTAVSSPSGFVTGISPSAADVISRIYVAANADLQWSEGSYRGFFTLEIDPHSANATYYAMTDISNPNLGAFASADFVVEAAGGSVSAGVLKSSIVGRETLRTCDYLK